MQYILHCEWIEYSKEWILRFSVDLSCEIIGNVVTDIILGPNTIHRNFQSWYNSIQRDREVIYTNN